MAKPIHVKHFDNGNRTPAEMHRELGLGGARCSTCDEPAALAAKFMAEDSEYMRRFPNEYIALIEKMGGDPAFKTKYGRMVHFNTMYACDRCKSGLRRYAAQQEDWVLVDWDEAGLTETYKTQV